MTKEEVYANRNEIGLCPCCNGNIKDRKIALYKGLIDALYKVYVWCGQHNTHEFHTKDIKHLLSTIDYTRFGDLVRFGGIVYKHEKASYGINMQRAKEFFAGERDIPLQITIEQFNKTIIDEVRGKIGDFPELYKLLKSDGMYDYEMDVRELR